MRVAYTPERADEAQRLRAQGLTLKVIGQRLGGVTPQTVKRWVDPEYAERQRAICRAGKERYKGTCIQCGNPTNNGTTRPPERCDPCARQHYKRWTREEVVRAIQRFSSRYNRPPALADFNPSLARWQGHNWRADRFYEDGDYPHVNSVIGHGPFGTWREALTESGFPAGKSYKRVPGSQRGAHLETERKAA